MTLAEVTNPFLQSPGGAKFTIGWIALFHTIVASLSIGFAFVVTVLQIAGYSRRENRFDLLAKRVQLWHVCIYNIGTINAIGLVFALSGLYPQFWSQAFTQFFWTLIIEEALFFMLATTLTLHYFFWDTMWGHKRLHIFLGAMLTPFFFLQVFAIHGIGSYILTPGFAEGQVSLWSGTRGLLGWDKWAFYNPSFLMLTFHRTFANFAYGGFFVAGICGILLFLSPKDERRQSLFETGGRLTFSLAFANLLLLPIAGFFYAWILKYHAKVAYDNLMIGRGDILAGGIDWWWTKQIIVASMLGMGLAFARRSAKTKSEFSLPMLMVYAPAFVYLMFYIGMGMQMTWRFFWGSLGAAVLAGLIATHLLNRHEGSGRAVFIAMGLLSLLTVGLGGYVREAARPRFVTPTGERVAGFNRMPDYSEVYVAPERPELMTINMVRERPAYVDGLPGRLVRPDPDRWTAADIVSYRCISCHTLERVRRYQGDDWERVVGRMHAYGMRITPEEMRRVAEYLEAQDQ